MDGIEVRHFVSHHAQDGDYERALRKLTTWPRTQRVDQWGTGKGRERQCRKLGNRMEEVGVQMRMQLQLERLKQRQNWE